MSSLRGSPTFAAVNRIRQGGGMAPQAPAATPEQPAAPVEQRTPTGQTYAPYGMREAAMMGNSQGLGPMLAMLQQRGGPSGLFGMTGGKIPPQGLLDGRMYAGGPGWMQQQPRGPGLIAGQPLAPGQGLPPAAVEPPPPPMRQAQLPQQGQIPARRGYAATPLRRRYRDEDEL